MMLLDLICFDCIMEKVRDGFPYSSACEPIMTPFEQVNNDGIYDVNCEKGHKCKTIIDNIDFEILFEYAINAIADGYYREAVSTFTASMERYFEFFIKVILHNSNSDFASIDKVWKNIAAQSERQFGAYIIAYYSIFGSEPPVLSQNKEIPFRNSVIHKGYIPTKKEAIDYGDAVLNVIETSLLSLKSEFPKATNETFEYYGYKKSATAYFTKIEKETAKEQNYACVNIMTTIDVMHGREINTDDGRKGNVEKRISDIIQKREPRKLTFIKEPKK